MTLEQLRSFRAVIETGSFRAAAQSMHRTQPAITHQIKALERELGHVLIERRAGRATPAGQRLYERACALLSDADALARVMREFDESQAGELRVGSSDTTALYVLPPIVRRFIRSAPAVRLQIVNRPTEVLADLVARGELDLGIVTLPTGHPNLDERQVYEQELVLVVPRNHRLASQKNVALVRLQDESLLLLEEQTRTGKLLREVFREQGFEPNVALRTSSFEVIKRYVSEGIGVSFLPRNAVTRKDTGVVAVEVRGLPRIRIGVVWRRAGYLTQAAQVFLRQLESQCGGEKS